MNNFGVWLNTTTGINVCYGLVIVGIVLAFAATAFWLGRDVTPPGDDDTDDAGC